MGELICRRIRRSHGGVRHIVARMGADRRAPAEKKIAGAGNDQTGKSRARRPKAAGKTKAPEPAQRPSGASWGIVEISPTERTVNWADFHLLPSIPLEACFSEGTNVVELTVHIL